MEHLEFWARFDAAVAPYDLLQHPFYQAWTAGELTRGDLREYAAEYWHHVSAFPTYLSALHSRLPDGPTRREVLRNLADEEGVDHVGGRPHSELWMDFAVGMGGCREDVAVRQTVPEMQVLIAWFRTAMTEGTAAALASLYAYESRVPAIAREKAAGLAAFYEADGATTRYFRLHTTADVAHAAVWRGLIEAEIAGDSAAAEAALASGAHAAKALWTALDGVDRLRTAAA